jgi:hypothetical protein
MKKYYLLPLITLIFFVSKAQEVNIKKNNYELITVSKYQEIVDITFTSVVYLMKDVELKEENKLTLSQNEYSQLIAQLLDSIKNKKDRVFDIGDNNIIIDYENTFYLYSKRKLLKHEHTVRFSNNGYEYSVYLTKEDIEKLIV